MSLFTKMKPFLLKHIKQLILGMVGMGIFTILNLMPPLILRSIINNVVLTKTWQMLLPLILLYIAAPIVARIIHFFDSHIINLAGFRLLTDIRMAIYQNVLRLSMQFHQDNSAGMLVNRLMDDVNMLQQLITGNTVTIIINLIVFIASSVIVFMLNPLLALILVVIIVLYVMAYRYFAKKIEYSSFNARRIYDQISERLEETVAGVRHVRNYNKETEENTLFLNQTSNSLRFILNSNMNSVSLGTVCTLIAGIGTAIIATVGYYFVLKGEMLYGDIVAINYYIWMALNPAVMLTNMAGQLTETMVSANRVFEILDEKPAIVSRPGAPDIERRAGAVEFRDVHFAYAPNIPLYRGLNLKIDPGKTVALVGHTGCGKTTLTTLIQRYWDIQKGQILIDGQDIKDVQLRSLRELFGVVLQDPVIFDGTVRENIIYGVRDAAMEQVENAARAAEIWEMVHRLPDGFDTYIGTRGIKLSVGEKQRLSIARAIIKDPLILIMDEATSSLDSESEALIQKALNNILKGRTSFVVAHRLSTITSADIIVVMDKGVIIEQGTHAELMMKENGAYRHLYEELQGSVKGGIR